MNEKVINANQMDIDGSAVENAMHTYMKDKNAENLTAFMKILKDARFLAPVYFPKDLPQETLDKLKKGEPVSLKEIPKLIPAMYQTKSGDRLLPAFTAKDKLPKKVHWNAIVPVPFREVLRVAQTKGVNAKGILINPGTDAVLLNPPLIQKMNRVMNGESVEEVVASSGAGTEKKTIKMTKAQFHAFARRNLETQAIPKMAFSKKGAFMDDLSANREQMIAQIYERAYKKAPMPSPYKTEDFDVMVLDISDTMTVASIGLPSRNLVPGTCSSVYVIYNPQTEDIKYFTVEKTKEKDQNKLGQVTADGSYTVIGDAPAPGCEISGILEMLQNEDSSLYS